MPLDRFQGSLGQKVYQSLQRAILTLAFRPGDIIRKPEICDRLGVSRSPVADAVARLAADGLVDVVPQAGTFVTRLSMTDIREGDVGAILGWGFAPWSGGPFSWLDIIGAARAVEICRGLTAQFGPRFHAPALLREMAGKGETFYGRFAGERAAA